MLRTLFHSLLITLLSSTAFADVSASVVQVNVSYQTCRQNSCSIVNDKGSGVVVGSLDGLPIVATCNHVVQRLIAGPSTSRCTVVIDGQRHEASAIGYSVRLDLALLKVWVAPIEVEVAEIEEDARLVSDVQLVGFPRGQFSKVKAKVKGRSPDGITVDRSTSVGQSGGGLFAGERLVGIVYGDAGENSGESYSTSGRALAQMCRHYKVKLKARGKLPDAQKFAPPIPPPPPDPGTIAENPATNPAITTQLKEIAERLAAIETKAGVPGPIGAKGDPGPAGKDGTNGKDGQHGPAGSPGKDADKATLDALTKRLSAIESRGLTVQLLDDSGVVISEQTYAPGSPVKLQFNPLK
jgi:hypothetical protein